MEEDILDTDVYVAFLEDMMLWYVIKIVLTLISHE